MNRPIDMRLHPKRGQESEYSEVVGHLKAYHARGSKSTSDINRARCCVLCIWELWRKLEHKHLKLSSRAIKTRISKQRKTQLTSTSQIKIIKTTKTKACRARGSSSSSEVTCVSKARFFTSPHDSPSGVSQGQIIPHWLGCSALGPETLRVFSNWDRMRVIMPIAPMNDNLESTCRLAINP